MKSFKRYVDLALLAVAASAAVSGCQSAHAEVRQVEQRTLPSDETFSTGTLFVLEDKARGVVCYVVKQNGAPAVSCVPLRSL